MIKFRRQSTRLRKNGEISFPGQSRHFGGVPVTSGHPRLATIPRFAACLKGAIFGHSFGAVAGPGSLNSCEAADPRYKPSAPAILQLATITF
jgi:hypothetical protein